MEVETIMHYPEVDVVFIFIVIILLAAYALWGDMRK